MASNKYQTVVQGEASETDSDEEAYITSLSSSYPVAAGVKVLGEASETDSEDEAGGATRPIEERAATEDVQKDLPPLIVIRDPPDSPVSVAEEKPVLRLRQGGRYSTLLQQKLQESNARLCGDVTQTVRQVYQNATKEIRLATAHLNNSQSGIIGASHSIRLLLEDLKSVSEKIDIITSCNLLPDIRISTPQIGLKEC